MGSILVGKISQTYLGLHYGRPLRAHFLDQTKNTEVHWNNLARKRKGEKLHTGLIPSSFQVVMQFRAVSKIRAYYCKNF